MLTSTLQKNRCLILKPRPGGPAIRSNVLLVWARRKVATSTAQALAIDATFEGWEILKDLPIQPKDRTHTAKEIALVPDYCIEIKPHFSCNLPDDTNLAIVIRWRHNDHPTDASSTFVIEYEEGYYTVEPKFAADHGMAPRK